MVHLLSFYTRLVVELHRLDPQRLVVDQHAAHVAAGVRDEGGALLWNV
jgi:hypothetical protein